MTLVQRHLTVKSTKDGSHEGHNELELFIHIFRRSFSPCKDIKLPSHDDLWEKVLPSNRLEDVLSSLYPWMTFFKMPCWMIMMVVWAVSWEQFCAMWNAQQLTAEVHPIPSLGSCMNERTHNRHAERMGRKKLKVSKLFKPFNLIKYARVHKHGNYW